MKNPFKRKAKIEVWVESYKGQKRLKNIDATLDAQTNIYVIPLNAYENVKVKVQA